MTDIQEGCSLNTRKTFRIRGCVRHSTFRRLLDDALARLCCERTQGVTRLLQHYFMAPKRKAEEPPRAELRKQSGSNGEQPNDATASGKHHSSCTCLQRSACTDSNPV